MPETGRKRPSPIAASAKAKETLRRLTKLLKVQQIDLLDHIVEAADHYIEHHGGRLILPLRFTETFRVINIGAGGFGPTVLEEPPRRGQRGKSKLVGSAHEG